MTAIATDAARPAEFARTPPCDIPAEQAALGAALISPDAVADMVLALRPGDFYRPAHQIVFEAVCALHGRGEPVDQITVAAELLARGEITKVGGAPYLIDLAGMCAAPASASWYAQRVVETAERRAALGVATRLLQRLSSPEADVRSVAIEGVDALEPFLVPRGSAPASPPLAVEDFLLGPTSYDWLVPDLFERGDRLILTGTEGGGKSVLLRQLAMCAAVGVHPFNGKPHPPCRVLVVDCENGPKLLRRKFGALMTLARGLGRAPEGRLMVEAKPPLDLIGAGSDDLGWLLERATSAQADIVMIGPLYRLHSADTNLEPEATRLLAALELLRSRLGAVVVTEAHSPHKEPGRAQRDLRPVGSSAFKRWPEFGYGIRETAETTEAGDPLYALSAWRPPREERAWPRQLRWGRAGEWPWVDVGTGGWL